MIKRIIYMSISDNINWLFRYTISTVNTLHTNYFGAIDIERLIVPKLCLIH